MIWRADDLNKSQSGLQENNSWSSGENRWYKLRLKIMMQLSTKGMFENYGDIKKKQKNQPGTNMKASLKCGSLIAYIILYYKWVCVHRTLQYINIILKLPHKNRNWVIQDDSEAQVADSREGISIDRWCEFISWVHHWSFTKHITPPNPTFNMLEEMTNDSIYHIWLLLQWHGLIYENLLAQFHVHNEYWINLKYTAVVLSMRFLQSF